MFTIRIVMSGIMALVAGKFSNVHLNLLNFLVLPLSLSDVVIQSLVGCTVTLGYLLCRDPDLLRCFICRHVLSSPILLRHTTYCCLQ